MEVAEIIPVKKKVESITFLFFRTETHLTELGNFTSVANDLYAEAVRCKLPIAGPAHWHYFGCNGNIVQKFTLEIALPVRHAIAEYDGAFHFKRTEPFSCVSLLHEGNWHELSRSYDKLMEFMRVQKLRASDVNREIYINVDFENPQANVTEIQVGIL